MDEKNSENFLKSNTLFLLKPAHIYDANGFTDKF